MKLNWVSRCLFIEEGDIQSHPEYKGVVTRKTLYTPNEKPKKEYTFDPDPKLELNSPEAIDFFTWISYLYEQLD